MMNRLDGNSRSAAPHQSTHAVSSEELATAESTPIRNSRDAIEYDDWDIEDRYRDYLPSQSETTSPPQAGSESGFSIWEAQLDGETQWKDDQTDNFIADKLAEAFQANPVGADVIAERGAEFDFYLNQAIFDGASTADLAGALANRDEVVSALHEQFSTIDGLDDSEVDDVIERVLSQTNDVITSRAHFQVQQAVDTQLSQAADGLAKLSSNARPIAEELIKRSGDADEMTTALRELGLRHDDAGAIAKELASIAESPIRRRMFLNGQEGQAEVTRFGDGWKDVEVSLENAFLDTATDLNKLRERAANDVHTNSRILTSGLWEKPREAALANMASDMDPDQAASFRNEIEIAVGEGKSADRNEAYWKAGIAVFTALGTGGLSLGPAAGLAMTGLSSAESLNSSYADLDAALVADDQGMAAQGEVTSAKIGLGLSVAAAVVSSASAGIKLDDVGAMGRGPLGQAADTVAMRSYTVGFNAFEAAAGGAVAVGEQGIQGAGAALAD